MLEVFAQTQQTVKVQIAFQEHVHLFLLEINAVRIQTAQVTIVCLMYAQLMILEENVPTQLIV